MTGSDGRKPPDGNRGEGEEAPQCCNRRAGMDAKLMEAGATPQARRPEQAEKPVPGLGPPRPDHVAQPKKAATLEDQGKHQEALASYDNSMKVQPTSDAWWGRSTVLQLMKRFDEALLALKQAYALEPSRPYLPGAILNLKMQVGDWDNFAQDSELVLKGVDKGLAVAMPGCTLLLPSHPAPQPLTPALSTPHKL